MSNFKKLSILIIATTISISVYTQEKGDKTTEVNTQVLENVIDNNEEIEVVTQTATIHFYRKKTMLAAAIKPTLKMNGSPIWQVRQNWGKSFIVAAPYEYHFSIKTEGESKLDIQAEPGMEYYVKIFPLPGFFKANFGFALMTDAEIAQKEMKVLNQED